MTLRLTSSSLRRHVAEAGGRGHGRGCAPCWRRWRRRPRGSGSPGVGHRGVAAGRRRRRRSSGAPRAGAPGAAAAPQARPCRWWRAGAVVGEELLPVLAHRRRIERYRSYISSTSQALGPNCSASTGPLPRRVDATGRPGWRETAPAGSVADPAMSAPPSARLRSPLVPARRSPGRLRRRGRRPARRPPRLPTRTSRSIAEDIQFDKKQLHGGGRRGADGLREQGNPDAHARRAGAQRRRHRAQAAGSRRARRRGRVYQLPAGTYTVYCDITGHRAAGMVATPSTVALRRPLEGRGSLRKISERSQRTAHRTKPAMITFRTRLVDLLGAVARARSPPMRPRALASRTAQMTSEMMQEDGDLAAARGRRANVRPVEVRRPDHEPQHRDREERVLAAGEEGPPPGRRRVGIGLAGRSARWRRWRSRCAGWAR